MVKYTLIRSKNRRHSVAMQMSQSGELVVRAPVYMPKFLIDRFVAGHTKWVEKQKTRAAKPQPILHKHFDSLELLEQFIRNTVGKYEKLTGLNSSGLKFRQVKSYWGSCSPSGTISFNHHLQYAPKEAVEYVVVHELCHLRYRGHGKRFWDLVTKHFPRENEMRKVLRQIPRE